jgi:hypothetical protein
MSKLLKCKIDVLKINKELLFKGAKGTYLDIDIWIQDKPDQYGNDISIQQSTKKDEPKIYLGNGKVKEFEKKESGPTAKDEYQKSGSKEAIVNASKENDKSDSDLPWD